MSGDLGVWYRSIPQITRYWFTASVALPLLGKIGIVSGMSMILQYQMVVHKFQVWRPITALFYYPVTPQTGFHYLINLYFLYSYSTRLETGVFAGFPADYLFMLIFNWICLVIIGLITEIFLLMDPMVLSVMYVWCQLNRDTIVSFWFGTQFKAMYLPWVLVGFNIILRGGGWTELFGILVGHAYFFLKYKYPQDFGGQQFLVTPSFLYRYFPSARGGVSGFGQAPVSRRRADDHGGGAGGGGGGGGRYQWGRGNTLGGN